MIRLNLHFQKGRDLVCENTEYRKQLKPSLRLCETDIDECAGLKFPFFPLPDHFYISFAISAFSRGYTLYTVNDLVNVSDPFEKANYSCDTCTTTLLVCMLGSVVGQQYIH